MCIRDSLPSHRGSSSAGGPMTDVTELEPGRGTHATTVDNNCLLYTSDAADERSSVDLGGRRIIKKKTREAKDRQQTVVTHR